MRKVTRTFLELQRAAGGPYIACLVGRIEDMLFFASLLNYDLYIDESTWTLFVKVDQHSYQASPLDFERVLLWLKDSVKALKQLEAGDVLELPLPLKEG